jgi:signal transduction histidine kinase
MGKDRGTAAVSGGPALSAAPAATGAGPAAGGPPAPLRLAAGNHRDGQNEVLRRVSAAVLAVTRELSVGDVLQVIVRSARSLSGARYAAIGIPDDHGSFAEFVVDGISGRQRKAIGPLPRQHGVLAVMLREGQPLRLADIRADPRFEGWPRAHPDLADILGMPIKDGDRVLGFIFAANKSPGAGFTVRDEELLSLFATHAAIALTNARLYERARQLSVLEERARLARDLHDAVSQKLFSIRVKARAASVLAARDPAGGNPERAAAEMESVAALAGAAQAELRAVIDGLAPPDISEGGLTESLRRYALLAAKAHGVRVGFAASDLPALGADREAALYRVAQEALHNALRHSGAAEVQMTVCASPRRVTLEVTDDGQGFAPELAPSGRGLPSMRERAAGAGASLVVRSTPGHGTTVRLVMPVDRAHATGRGRPA